MKTVNCHVQSISALTPHVYKVLLKPSEPFSFSAGQYLNFVMSEEDKRPFSIASSPNSEIIELQVGAFVSDSYPMQVIEKIKQCEADNTDVTVEIGLGDAQLRDESERPLLLLAGGTGFSYIKSMFEYLAEQKSTREVIVYWGLREESACYELTKTAETINQLANGKFIPVIQSPTENWQGKTGLVHEVAMNDIKNLAAYDIYLAGRFDMVGAIRTDFTARGALVDHMFADAFAYI